MFFNIINKLEEGVISLLLVFTTLLVFLDVVLRFGFNTGFLWTQELTLLASGWFVLFGTSYGIKVGAHIGVDAVVRLLPDRTKRVVSVVAVLLALAYAGLFIAGGWTYLSKMYVIGIGLEDVPVPGWLLALFSDEFLWETLRVDSEDPKVPLWFAHGILLVGMVLIIIRLVMLLWGIIVGRATGFQFADEAEESMHLVEHEEEAEDSESGETRP